MSKQIAVFGTSANPFGVHHTKIVAVLAHRFDEVIVVPCGPRPDKESANEIAPFHRGMMARLATRNLPSVRVDCFDLANETYTRTIDLDARYHQLGRIWHYIGADLVRGGRIGKSAIQLEWEWGNEIWENLGFVVGRRRGYEIDEHDLPPHAVLLDLDIPGASTNVRELIRRSEPIDEFVTPEVADYIKKHRLYLD